MGHCVGVCSEENVASVVPGELHFTEKHVGTVLFL